MKPQSPMSALPASEAALRKLHDPIPMKALKTALPSSSGLQSLYNMDMNDCYSKLRELVPTIPSNKKMSRIEILQHVIDYIQDLQTALDGHPGVQALSLSVGMAAETSPTGRDRKPLGALALTQDGNNRQTHTQTLLSDKPETVLPTTRVC
ncbi:DNA-binding protein inhibitor ID-2-A-like [Branchiostoma lanceolatum]|uniref:DNA-binding protein inhibitor ID-2-A-like n=1 Tax=Branchiostoma lanceolatum TaxID=7740 RepID=UPI001132E512